MSLFIFDTAGNKDSLNKNVKIKTSSSLSLLDVKPKQRILDVITDNKLVSNDAEEIENEDFFGLPPPNVDLSNIISESLAQQASKSKMNKSQLEFNYAIESVNAAAVKAEERQKEKYKRIRHIDHSDFNELTKTYDGDEQLRCLNIDEELNKSKLPKGFEKKNAPQIQRPERVKSKGSSWANMPATEVTEEIRNDLKILQMRSALNPKQFYKKNDLKVLPKYFQVGTVLHSPLDHYNERNTRKNKKKTLVDELLADGEFQQYTKRKYKEIMSRRDYYSRRKAMKKLKKLKK